MREQEFRGYLETHKDRFGNKLAQTSKNAYVKDNKRIEEQDGFNLDDEFKKDRLESLLIRYAYGREAERNNNPNPTNIDIKPQSLYNSLKSHRSALNHYIKFCEKNPPK